MRDELLIEQLTAGDAALRLEAAEALMQTPTAAAAVALVAVATDADERVREAAHGALEEIVAPLAEHELALGKVAVSSDGDDAYWAITLLGRIASPSGQTVENLAEVVSAQRPIHLRQRAAWALGQHRAAAQPALEQLREAAASDDARLSRLAQRAIDNIAAS